MKWCKGTLLLGPSTSALLLAFGGALSVVPTCSAATRYVALSNHAPAYPYTNWATAARVIQDAVDAADAGDEILVTNGIYATGGRALSGGMNNRVAIDKAVTVRSVNGPNLTMIVGQGSGWPWATNNGYDAIRCAYLGYDAVLSGFTLTNGHTQASAGADQSGGGAYCQGGVITNCTLTGNSASQYGGGAMYGTLNNCSLTGNAAVAGGGGACQAVLNNCTLTGNSSGSYAGGAYYGALKNCTVTGNAAQCGGGTYHGSLTNCIVYYNVALEYPNYFGSTFAYSCTTPLPPGTGNINTDPLLASPSHLSAQSPCIGRGSPFSASGVDIDGEAWLDPPCMGADQFVAGAATGEVRVAITAAYTNLGAGFAVSFVGQISGRLTDSVWDFGDGVVISDDPYPSHAWAVPGLYEVRLTGFNDSYPAGIIGTVLVQVAPQAVYYVDAANLNPAYPYTSWAAAATTIQEAIDAGTQIGRLVRVTNGVYARGGRPVFGTMTNRVVLMEGVIVRSENGPLVTFITGQPAPGTTTNGEGAVRCSYLGRNVVLSGFTLTNGYTRTNGDYYLEQSGGGAWCKGGLITNCILTGNSGFLYGGGTYYGTLNNCTLTGNSAGYAGGAASYGTLNNCTLTSNFAGRYGAGAYGSTLNNSILTSNSAVEVGGGAYDGMLNNCTLTGNSATLGGGASGSTLNNCIVYYNLAQNGPNYFRSTFAYSCTTPLASGAGNIELEPRLASASHVSTESPCIGRGSPFYASGVDIDGEGWLDPPCMGADQLVAGAATGELAIAIATDTNVSAKFTASCVAQISGRLTEIVWDFGDGVVVSNRAYASHAWASPGLYEVHLTGYNDSFADGVAATVLVQVAVQEVYYVNATNPTPVYPYTSWAGAATTIQEAIDAGSQLGRLVRVADGLYARGGRAVFGLMTNRIVVPEGVEVRSENGPLVTSIAGQPAPGTTNNGDGAIRCAYLAYNAVLSGFTVTNGHTLKGNYFDENHGGGAWCEPNGVLTNCILTGNMAFHGAGAAYGTLNTCTLIRNWARDGGGGVNYCTLKNCTLTGNSAGWEGGGAYNSTLNNCILIGNSTGNSGGGASFSMLNNCAVAGNSAGSYGGGAHNSTLNNCTLAGNSAGYGGGADYSTLNNCIVYYNKASTDPNSHFSTFAYSCTIPFASGIGNITNAPLFMNTNNWTNLRLQSNSPCINAGHNSYVLGDKDLDGRPRIVGQAVDMGAFEYQGAGMSEFFGWLQQYGLPTDGSADSIDSDGDGLNNWQEWRCQTDPTNALLVLRLLSSSPSSNGVNVRWQSVPGVSYKLECSTNLGASPRFTVLATNLPGQTGTTTFTDTNITLAPRFYRVGTP